MNRLKEFNVSAHKAQVAIRCRKMSGLTKCDDWEDATHAEFQVYHRAKFEVLARQAGLRVWEMPDHWFGVMASDRLSLIGAVVNTLYDDHDNWQEGEVGLQIAYLTLAISNNSRFGVAGDVPWSVAFLETLKRLFPPHHPVWPFISLSDPQYGNSLNR